MSRNPSSPNGEPHLDSPRCRPRESYSTVQRRHVRQCLKEAWIAGAIWLVGFVWCVSVIVTRGYIPVEDRPDVPDMVWGLPSWVVWGLFVPWFVLIAATWWFAAFVMKEDEPYMEFPGKETGERGTTNEQ